MGSDPTGTPSRAAAPRTSFVTGANRGLGLEIVRLLAARGPVVAACRRPADAVALDDLGARYPGRLTKVAVDLADASSVAAAVAECDAVLDRLDILVNCAGRNRVSPDEAHDDGTTALGTLDAAALAELFHVNAVSPLLLVQGLMGKLVRARAPIVVNVTSERGSAQSDPGDRKFGYRASKAALNSFTRTLARRVARDGITVVAVDPGWVRTDMGGPEAPQDAADCARRIVRLLDQLDASHGGMLLDPDGRALEW
ncbi:MAG TPA: SDR family NAD(P)-dependent oxidoreductase [Actinomycetota bacterium]|nr:SDR family NAD(P)-dependent oxidoreductase [Actinomycetota bacterium]